MLRLSIHPFFIRFFQPSIKAPVLASAACNRNWFVLQVFQRLPGIYQSLIVNITVRCEDWRRSDIESPDE